MQYSILVPKNTVISTSNIIIHAMNSWHAPLCYVYFSSQIILLIIDQIRMRITSVSHYTSIRQWTGLLLKKLLISLSIRHMIMSHDSKIRHETEKWHEKIILKKKKKISFTATWSLKIAKNRHCTVLPMQWFLHRTENNNSSRPRPIQHNYCSFYYLESTYIGKKLGSPSAELRGFFNCLISHNFKVLSPVKQRGHG